MKNLLFICLAFSLASCSTTKTVKQLIMEQPTLLDHNTFLLTDVSTDPTYALTPENAVRVGGSKESSGPLNERRFLNALAGPDGEAISYYRSGSCCPVQSKNAMFGMAMIDHYKVTWEGTSDTVSIYINMYDHGPLQVPVGFTIREATKKI